MKIYTRTGDRGDTGLFGGSRVSKSSGRVEAYGSVDELNSVIGLACTLSADQRWNVVLATVQSELFNVGAELACVPGKEATLGVPLVSAREVEQLERTIDAAEQDLSPLKTFILPGGCPEGAALHLARTTCRRAERAVVALAAAEAVRPEVLTYLNRLSDLLFVLGRHANQRHGVADVPWIARTGAAAKGGGR